MIDGECKSMFFLGGRAFVTSLRERERKGGGCDRNVLGHERKGKKERGRRRSAQSICCGKRGR